MIRYSQYLMPTTKETPSDAEVVSHRLMLRAGLIRKVASGIYNYLPAGLRVMRKVEKIIREEGQSLVGWRRVGQNKPEACRRRGVRDAHAEEARVQLWCRR